jgi:cell division protein FtsQ
VAALPWVQSVEVRKRWPDRLELVITEHTAVARWGDAHLLSATGVLIDLPPDGALPPGLPLLQGPVERSDEVVALYDQAQPLFVALGERVGQVELSPRGSWRVVLESGVELVVGRDDALPRLARFARLMPALVVDEPRRLARADLRYTNGFALAWQSAGPAPEQQGTQ